MLPKSSLWLLSLMLFISACNPNPQQAPQNQAPQEQATPIPNPVISQYVAAVAGVTFLQPIGDYYRIHENLDPAIDLHVEAFLLKDGKPNGAALGLDLSRHNHKIQVSNNFLFKEYRTRWHIRDFDIPEGSLIRLEVRNNRAKHGEAACHDNKATLNTGCLGFVDLAVYPRQWYARVLTDYPEVAAEEQGSTALVTQAKDTFLAEERAFAENYAAEDNIDIAQLVAQEITGQGFFDDTRAGKSIILWGGSLHLRFHVARGANNSPPQINIQAPTLDNFTSNEKIVLAAQAMDLEDGDISNNITWSSSIDGALGTGAQLLKKLSVGTHTLTAQVADSGAKTATTTYNVTIIDSSTIPAMPDGWEATIVPNDPATGTGVVIPLANENTNEATNNTAASINTTNTTTTPRRFLLRGYDSQVFLSQALTNDNSEVKACFDTTKLAANAYVSLGASQNINPDINPDGLATPWAKAIATGKTLPQAKSDETEASNGTIAKAVCFVVRKSNHDIKIFESSATTFTAASADTLTLIQSYPISLSAPYRLFASLSTPANNQTSPTTIANNQAIVTIAITHLPDDVPVDPEDDPNTETVQATVDFNLDTGVAGGEFDFNAAGSQGTDLSYKWDFGDGTSSEKSFVRHTYTAPGKYDISLTITNSVGRTDTLTDTVYIFPAVENVLAVGDAFGAVKLNSPADLSVPFNLGTSFDGFRYELDFGDNRSHNGGGGVINHTYQKPGTYTYKLEIFDERPATNSFNNQELARQSQATLPIYSADRWFTLFGAPVKAEFTMQNLANGANDGNWYGPITPDGLKIRFDASQSEGAGELSYTWQFADGATADGKVVVHEFKTQGLHLVTLTVKDALGYQEQYRQFVRTRTFNPTAISSNIRFYYTYPNKQSSVQSQRLLAAHDDIYARYAFAEDVSGLLALDDFALDVIGEQHATANAALQTQALQLWKEHHPYVVYHNANDPNMANIRMSNLIIDHRDFDCRDNEHNNPGTYVSFYDVSINGIALEGFHNYMPLAKKTATHLNPNLPDLCKGVLVRFPKIRELLPRTSPAEIRVATLLQDIRYEVNHFAGLRVPRVSVAILPDVFLDGKEAKPGIAEYTFQNSVTGKNELMMLVQARKSHIVNGQITLEIPVYAVDKDGKYLPSANGYFNASFLNVESNCGDCVMVNGRSTIKVKLDIPADIQPDLKKPITFDLTKVELSRDGTCTTDASEGPKLGAFLNYCTVIDTSYTVPDNPPTFEPYPYTTPTAAKFRSGEITFPDTAGNFVKYVRENPVVFVIDITLNLIPFYGLYEKGQDFFDAIDKIGTGEASWSEIGSTFTAMLISAGAEATGIIADTIATLNTVNRISRISSNAARVASRTGGSAGSRVIANVFDESTERLFRNGKPDVDDITNEFSRRHGNYLNLIDFCKLSTTSNRIATQSQSTSPKDLISGKCAEGLENIVESVLRQRMSKQNIEIVNFNTLEQAAKDQIARAINEISEGVNIAIENARKADINPDEFMSVLNNVANIEGFDARDGVFRRAFANSKAKTNNITGAYNEVKFAYLLQNRDIEVKALSKEVIVPNIGKADIDVVYEVNGKIYYNEVKSNNLDLSNLDPTTDKYKQRLSQLLGQANKFARAAIKQSNAIPQYIVAYPKKTNRTIIDRLKDVCFQDNDGENVCIEVYDMYGNSVEGQ